MGLPAIERAAGQLFRDGHYANAILDALKALNALVRLNSGVDDKDGTSLMEHVFSPKNPILKFNSLADQSDRAFRFDFSRRSHKMHAQPNHAWCPVMPNGRKFGPGRCVHCLKDVEARNSDHVFPQSWYPDSTPPNLEKWQVPSCIRCNSDYGRLEKEFLIKVGLCLDPSDQASKGVVERALRSLKPSAGRNPRDAQHRLNKRRKIMAEALHGDAIPDHGHFPGLGYRWPHSGEEPVAVLVPAGSFTRITEKIVRGIFYIEDQKFIEPPYKIDVYVLPEEDGQHWEQVLDKFGTVYAREPGIVVRRAVAVEDATSAVFAMTFWKQFKTYAVVSRE